MMKKQNSEAMKLLITISKAKTEILRAELALKRLGMPESYQNELEKLLDEISLSGSRIGNKLYERGILSVNEVEEYLY